jgi:hypothetical protein
MAQYVFYEGKSVELPNQSDWTQRTDAQNSAVQEIGLTGVNFKTNWSSQLSSAGAKLVNSKEEANKLVKAYEEEQAKIAAEKKRNEELNSLSEQIRRASENLVPAAETPEVARISGALSQLSGENIFRQQSLSGKLNSQIADDEIINDYNTTKLNRLNTIVSDGNVQIATINDRLKTANELIAKIPKDDKRYESSKSYLDKLNNDLASVTSAVSNASQQAKGFKPLSVGSTDAAKQITSFREYLQLPEERASQQLRQIDPESYETAVGLGRQYRQMAEQPIGATTTPETEQIRQTIEDEALNQLRLGSTIGAEERRGYEQSIRAAQTARGNVFGLGPAVQEASQIGAAGEQRKLARYGAAQSFLGSGLSSGDALKADIAFRDALRQNRLGAASNFVAGGPSIANLAAARTGQQQSAMQQYIQANQALPGGFNQQASTAAPFYQAVDQQIPVQLTNAFNQLYRSQADYGASTYGAQIGAISRQPNAFQNFATAAGGFKDLAGGVGGLASAGILCWVAREVYGIDNPKWLQFREWMLTKASDNLRNYYIEYGERIAKSIRNRPKIKALIRKWMDSKIG